MRVKVFLPLLALMLLIGCTQTMNLTPSAQYYSALKTWNDNLDTYLAAYDMASPETQKKWKATIDPLILAANKALDTWRISIGTSDAAVKHEIWLNAQKQAMLLLTQSGIIKIEGR